MIPLNTCTWGEAGPIASELCELKEKMKVMESTQEESGTVEVGSKECGSRKLLDETDRKIKKTEHDVEKEKLKN